MIHTVGTHSLNGSFGKSVNYVLGEKDHNGQERKAVTILDGNPNLLINLERDMNTKHTYIHTSLSFTKEETELLNSNPEKLNQILDSYRTQLAAGLPDSDTSRLATMVVKHDESDGKMHVHLLTLRQDLETGKTYQPFVVQRGDIERFQCWNVVMQVDHKLENPNSKEHQRSASWSKDLPAEVKAIRKEIDHVINEEIAAGNIACRKDIVDFINNTKGMVVDNTKPQSISIRVDNHKQNIRFKGAAYAATFTSTKDLSRVIEERASINAEAGRSRLSELMQRCETNSHKYISQNDQILGPDPHSSITDNISINTGMDMVSAQPDASRLSGDHESYSTNVGRATLDRGQSVPARQSEQKNVGSTNKPIAPEVPNHRIFHGVQWQPENQTWLWQGGYGYAQVQATDSGYALSHGNRMEWTMAAELLKTNGAESAQLTCSSEASLIRAMAAHSEAGLRVSAITLNGKQLNKQELKEVIHEHAEREAISRDKYVNSRAGQEGHTSSEIGSIEQADADRDKHFSRAIDDIEQSCCKINTIVEAVEFQQKQQEEEQELELSHASSYSRGR